MGSLKFLGTIAFKFKSIVAVIILFFRDIKLLLSGASVEGATSVPKSIIPVINSIRIWFLYVKDQLPEFITILIIKIIYQILF